MPESELADAQAKSRVGWREVLAEDRTSTEAREAAVGEEAAEVRDGAGTGGGEERHGRSTKRIDKGNCGK